MVKKESILSHYVRQKIKRPHKYERFAKGSNNYMFDFNQIINSKHEPFPVENLDREEFMKNQKKNIDLTFLEKTYKKVTVNGEREVNKDNLMLFKKISVRKHLGSPIAPQSMDWSIGQMYNKGYLHFEQYYKFMEKNNNDKDQAYEKIESMVQRIRQYSNEKVENKEENKNKL